MQEVLGQELTNSNHEFSHTQFSGRLGDKSKPLTGGRPSGQFTPGETNIAEHRNSHLIQILKTKMSASKQAIILAKESQQEQKQDFILNISRDSLGSPSIGIVGGGTPAKNGKLSARKSPLLLDLDEASHDRHAYIPGFDATRGVTAVYADCVFSDAEKSWDSKAERLRRDRASEESDGEEWIAKSKYPGEVDSFDVKPAKRATKARNRKVKGILELKSYGLQTKITKFLEVAQKNVKNHKGKSLLSQPEQPKTLHKFRPQDGQTNSNQASGTSIQISNLQQGPKVISEYKFLPGWGHILEKAHGKESMGNSRKTKNYRLRYVWNTVCV